MLFDFRMVDAKVLSMLSVLLDFKLRASNVLMKLTSANKLSIFYKFACAPSEDSDQPAHPRSLIRIFARALWVAKDPKRLQADGKCSGLHTQMRRLV